MEYLYHKLREYEKSDFYPFHMPGHKRNNRLTGATIPYGIDITEIDGFDDLHHPDGILREAQIRTAEVFSAEESCFLINGSTAGILSAVMGCTSRGGKILMARNCHKSVYNAVFMNLLQPVYLYPEVDSATGINGEIYACDVARLLDENPDVEAVIITSPTYDGIVSDVKRIAAEVHQRNIPLIVDEAHGAHFGFHPFFPENSNAAGADVVIHSLHKTLPAPTQTALLHMNGKLADRERIKMYLRIFQSSSPSYILLAGMDECVRVLKEHRETIFTPYVSMLARTRERLHQLNYMSLEKSERYDFSKLLISTAGITQNTMPFTGKILYRHLLETYHLQLEMAAGNYVIAMTGPGDSEEGMRRLAEALEETDEKLICSGEKKKTERKKQQWGRNERVYLAGEAEKLGRQIGSNNQNVVLLPWNRTVGKIVLEYAYVYPPGIPLVVPGERVSKDTVEQIIRYEKMGFAIEGTKVYGKAEVLLNG